MEISAEGEMADTYVYMGDTLIMDSYLRITDPVSGSMRKVNGSGVPLAYDPFGDDPNHIETAGMGTAVPPVIPETMPAPDYENGGYMGNAKDGCEVDGAPLPCTIAAQLARYIDELPKPYKRRKKLPPPEVIPAPAAEPGPTSYGNGSGTVAGRSNSFRMTMSSRTTLIESKTEKASC